MSERGAVEIIYEDDDLLVVNKPAGVLTIPDRAGNVSLRELLGARSPAVGPLRLVHRIDRETSGLLVLARTLHAQRELTRQFNERSVDKFYLAIVRGEPVEDCGLIDAPLAPRPAANNKIVVSTSGKPARTEWTLVERLSGFALLRCRLLTGRQHQIRVHLSHVGLPLLVDALYGSAEAFYLSSVKSTYHPNARHHERPLIDRLTLHAESIAFDHPSRPQRLALSVQPPKDFRATVNQLRKLKGSGSRPGLDRGRRS